MDITTGLNRLGIVCGSVLAVCLFIGDLASKFFDPPVPFLIHIAGPFLIAVLGFSIGWGAFRLVAWIIEGVKSGKKENAKE